MDRCSSGADNSRRRMKEMKRMRDDHRIWRGGRPLAVLPRLLLRIETEEYIYEEYEEA